MNTPRPRQSGSAPARRSGGGKRSGAPPRSGRPASARSARSLAIEALAAVDRGARANVIVPELLRDSGLAERDRAFVTELVYGTVRMRRACDWLVDRHLRRQTDPEVRAAVRIGAYQLVWLGTPVHAAVSATVDALGGPARGFVNAVLHRVADDVAAGTPAWPDDATRLSYPDWIVQRLQADIGREDALAALATMNEAAAATVRADGYVQDLASQWVGAQVGGGPGELIADLCAAPGGKTTWLAYGAAGPPAGAGGETGFLDGPGAAGKAGGGVAAADAGGRPAVVVGADLDRARAQVVAANAARLRLDNVATLVADACRPPLRRGALDRVLVDAPCSGLGVLRRRPDARWRIQPADLPRLAALQRRMLDAAIPLVRPGGLLVYSVCTLTLVETAGIDRWLADYHPQLRPAVPPGAPWQRVGRGARLLPQAAGTDGMFALVLRADT